MVRSHCHHNGRLCCYQIRCRSSLASAGSKGCPCLHCGGLYRFGHCGNFRGTYQQECSCSGRGGPKVHGRNKVSTHRDENDPSKIRDETGSEIPNGAAAAAILSAAVGCFCVSVFGWLGDAVPAIANFFNFYNPTGPLSGVTTTAIVVWLILWSTLSRTWGEKSLPMRKINGAAFLLLGVGLLISFPPFGDLLQGK
jgi:hypothetical protein